MGNELELLYQKCSGRRFVVVFGVQSLRSTPRCLAVKAEDPKHSKGVPSATLPAIFRDYATSSCIHRSLGLFRARAVLAGEAGLGRSSQGFGDFEVLWWGVGGGGRFLVHCVEVEVRNVIRNRKTLRGEFFTKSPACYANQNEPRGLCRNRKPNHRDPGAPIRS